MNLMELRNRTIRRETVMDNALEQKFESVSINGIPTFKNSDGKLFRLCSLPEDGAIVVEYADNYDEAVLNRFEDGDFFYLDEMSEDVMLQAILVEIEQ